jgi:hypothetical protein
VRIAERRDEGSMLILADLLEKHSVCVERAQVAQDDSSAPRPVK